MGAAIALDPVASSYALLGIEPGAGAERARQAYRGLARRLHPDVAGVEAGERFTRVHAAYRVVLDANAPGSAWRSAEALDAYAPRPLSRSRVVDVVVS